ncbi:MAG: class I SAM-dependent methyltransferase [Chloroflexi bacterium]|nr:class I SAM-dependent methyltransferase [Chloroflexota bacterium]
MTSEHYNMDTPDFIQRLLRPERAEILDPSVIMSLCPVKPQDRLVDIGCGPGYFTLPLATAAVNGKVYALDINREMVAACRERVEQARLGNVETLTCSKFDFPIDNGTMDGVFMAFVVQHPSDKPRLLRAVRDLLQPGGWCVVLEWYRKETETGPPLERRVDPGDLENLARGAGFQPMGWQDLNGEHYLMTLHNT